LFYFKISFYISNNKINLFFRYSYLLFPSSLAKLATNFQVDNKGIFPYKFINNDNIAIDYIGKILDLIYFDNLSPQNYIDYCNMFNNHIWNLREETIKYCNQDCITLYQIISIFQKKIFNLFRIDILKYPTLYSLAFAIYRTHFLKNEKIPLIDGDLFTQL
jgi:hypothetical protein